MAALSDTSPGPFHPQPRDHNGNSASRLHRAFPHNLLISFYNWGWGVRMQIIGVVNI